MNFLDCILFDLTPVYSCAPDRVRAERRFLRRRHVDGLIPIVPVGCNLSVILTDRCGTIHIPTPPHPVSNHPTNNHSPDKQYLQSHARCLIHLSWCPQQVVGELKEWIQLRWWWSVLTIVLSGNFMIINVDARRAKSFFPSWTKVQRWHVRGLDELFL